MKRGRLGIRWMVTAIWSLNAVGLVGVVAGVIIFNTRQQPVFEPQITEFVPASTSSPTLPPGIYYLPTVTPNPLATPIVAIQIKTTSISLVVLNPFIFHNPLLLLHQVINFCIRTQGKILFSLLLPLP